MSVEAAITDAVTVAVAPVLAELRELRAAIEALRAASPPKLVTVTEACRITGLSPATMRRRIADHSIASVRVGSRAIRVDVGSLKPVDPAVVAALVAETLR
jgi:excisionase family DNA binding protein